MKSPSKIAPNNSSPRCQYRKFDHKEKLRCRFCRGENCNRCGKNAHKRCVAPAISNFHCNWILDSVMAMQRPSDELFDSIMLIEAFQCNGITAVINLCEPGEHPYCGFPLKSSGFPYTPERLMGAGIKYFNFYWQDMTAPTMSLAQNTIRVALTEILKGGKVAIHCHAGFGRTGIVAACLSMILQKITAEDAVSFVRTKRPGSVQTTDQHDFVKQFHAIYTTQSAIYPLMSDQNNFNKTLDDSMNDELWNPPLHLTTSLNSKLLMTREELPNAIRLSAVIILHLIPYLGKVGLSLALARLTVTNVNVDRAISLSTIVASSLDQSIRSQNSTPIKGFLKNNIVKPDATGTFVCEAPEDMMIFFKSSANSGQWKNWFALPHSMRKTVPSIDVPSIENDVPPASLNDEDYDQQHIDVEKLLEPYTARENMPYDSSEGFSASDNQQLVSNARGIMSPPDLITLVACHGSLLLDWFDSRSDAMFSSPLLAAIRLLKFGDCGPYFFSYRALIPMDNDMKSIRSSGMGSPSSSLKRNTMLSKSSNSLDIPNTNTEEEDYASMLDTVLRKHLSKRKLLLLEAIVKVMSPLFDKDDGTEQGVADDCGDEKKSLETFIVPEVSIFLVCAEIRVAMSMCQHFSKMPQLLTEENRGINRKAVESLFEEKILNFDDNREIKVGSQTNGPPPGKEVHTFPATKDLKYLDDIVNVMNSLRFLAINKWSAQGDSFLSCSVSGSPSHMLKPMLSIWQKSVHWNEEWID